MTTTPISTPAVLARPAAMTRKGAWALAAWLGLLLGGLAVLGAADLGPVSAPPLAHPARLIAWTAARDPAVTVMVLLRWVGLGLGFYLIAATLAGVVARLLAVQPLVRMTDALTAPSLRRLLNAAAGISLLVATSSASAAGATTRHDPATVEPPTMQQLTAAPPSADDHGPVSPPVTMRRLPDRSGPGVAPPPSPAPTEDDPSEQVEPGPTDAGGPPPEADSPEPVGPPPTQPAIPPVAAAAPTEPATPPAPASAPVPATARRPPAPVPPAGPATWRVRPGDSLWSIAAAVLTAARHRAVSDAEIVPYWRQLIEVNRAALADRKNADLIFPDQKFTLPPAR